MTYFGTFSPCGGQVRCSKAVKAAFWPVFIYLLGLKTNGYVRKQLLN
jgi:hypothetical protein